MHDEVIARALALVAGAAAFCAALIPAAGGDSSASRIVDRTFVCGVKLRASERRIEPSAWSGFRDPEKTDRWKWLPYADIGGHDLIAYAFVAAGAPIPTPEPGATVAPFARRWAAIDAAVCRAATDRVALSARDLNGGPASQLQNSDEYECAASSRILIRVRAEFGTAVTFRAYPLFGRRYFTTTSATPATRASLAAATPAGKRIAYATVSETGKTTLFTAKVCTPQ